MTTEGNREVSSDLIRAELDKILRDPTFRRSGRLSSFLSFVVQQALEGAAARLKEYAIGTEVYGKGHGFDPRNDSTVRVEAARLRAKLREYYDTAGRTDPIRIDLPKGTYAPLFQRIEDDVSAPRVDSRADWRAWRKTALLAGCVIIAIGGVVLLPYPRQRVPSAINLPVPLTSLPGNEGSPAFSNDGKQVAFVWSGPNDDNRDIYIKPVESGSTGEGGLVRLSYHPASDLSPAWSRDGRYIAFFRASADAAFLVVPAGGGTEKVVSRAYPDLVGRVLDWLPAGDALVVSTKQTRSEPLSIKQVSISTGETRTLTSPPAGYGDSHPAVSPDGRMLAFTRSHSFPTSDLYTTNIVSGETRRLTFDNQVITGVAWGEDGRSIVISSERGGTAGAGGLWRAPIGGSGLEQLPGIGAVASLPAIARRGQLLAFQSSLADTNIWRIEPNAAPTKLISSTRQDQGAQYSPDGQWISFESNRSGNWEVWISRADGSDARQITRMAGAPARYARWSPDGRWLAFDYRGDGNSEIYMVSPDGGPPKPVTNDPASDETPDWSNDGKWLYFGSNRSGAFEIWKTPASTDSAAQAVRLTHDGGSWPTASRDGKWVYFVRGSWQKPELWRVAAGDGGAPAFVVALSPGLLPAWTVDPEGAYFIDRSGTTGPRIACFEFSTGLIRTIVLLDKHVHHTRLATSPDRKAFLYAQLDGGGGDLMLVRNFR